MGMKVLGIDTSSQTGSIAVVDGDTLLAERALTSGHTHAKRLMSAVDWALGMAGLSTDELDGFAVTTGPGSFTGLRIGISTIKGLAFAARKPVAGVSTLESLVHQFPMFPHLICPILDARKGEVYTALYRSEGHMKWKQLAEDCVAAPGRWVERIAELCLFVGDGLCAYGGLIREALGGLALFAPPYLNVVRASIVAHIGIKEIRGGNAVDVSRLAPHYIRRSDAETKSRPVKKT